LPASVPAKPFSGIVVGFESHFRVVYKFPSIKEPLNIVNRILSPNVIPPAAVCGAKAGLISPLGYSGALFRCSASAPYKR